MRFVGRGHPAIRATHDKTLEISPSADIGERATCVIAVASEGEPAAPLAGAIRLRIAAGSARFTLDAVANPCWQPGGAVVVRRSPLRLPGTFATEASAVAADLPRDMVAALQDPDVLVTVDVAPVPDTGETVVLFAADATAADDRRLAAEDARADTVVVDAGARALVRARSGAGLRTLVVAADGLPANPSPGARVETVGLPPPLAAAAAAGGGALTVAAAGLDPRAALRAAPHDHRVALVVPFARLDEVLQQAREIRGEVSGYAVQAAARPLPITGSLAQELATRGDVALGLAPVAAADTLDPAVRAAVDALLADGTATRSVARALTALTGWDRRRAYDAVLSRRG